MKPVLLTRDQFRSGVFERDSNRCVVRNALGVRCEQEAADAHHILERRLWSDGGYYLDNGASVCPDHHIEAEQTLIGCTDLREWAGITNLVIPDHLYRDQGYDKWGNPLLPNGSRMCGELFYDESVQKILAPVLHLFTVRVKYPRTYHLPWSPGVTKDDRVIAAKDLDALLNMELVVTAKMDGENTTMYRDGLHARSLDYEPHGSRDWVRALHARVAHEIPERWRICGENLFAKHSIHYSNLESQFLVFSIWDGLRCLSWDDTVEYAGMLNLPVVPALSRGSYLRTQLQALGPTLVKDGYQGDPCEGFVVRRADEFQYGDFRRSVAKYVRANHVQTHGHWMRNQITPNTTRRDDKH